jgi:hypothetical protein
VKKLLITLILISPLSFADWGDVYYCQETNRAMGNGGKFRFKLDETKSAVVFGSSGILAEAVFPLTNPLAAEWWKVSDASRSIYFRDGKLVYMRHAPSTALVMTADCDKF